MTMWHSLCFVALVILVSTQYIIYHWRSLKAVGNLPGLRCAFAPLSIPSILIGTQSWNPGLNWTWLWRSYIYQLFKSDTISVIPYVFGQPAVYTSSFEVATQVLNSNQYRKSRFSASSLLTWGQNVASANGDVYKRHRRIVGPAFSSGIYSLVWEETSNTYYEMMLHEGWSEINTVAISSFYNYTHKLALIMISRCGFGLSFPWSSSSSTMGETLHKSLLVLLGGLNTAIRRAAPRWLYWFPIKRLTDIQASYQTLDGIMKSLINLKKSQISNQDFNSQPDQDPSESYVNLFTRLVGENRVEKQLALSDTEVIGNMFIFLLAGHETTALGLAATLALLAIHPEEQDVAAEEIRSVLIDGRDPVFNDSHGLKKVLACFQEGVRMFPPAPWLMRETLETATIKIQTDNECRPICLPPESLVVIDVIGINYNPIYYEDPEVFKPSRWDSLQDANMIFFGSGPRACLGKKFAVTEALCFLTLILRDWTVSPLLLNGETRKQWRDRVFRPKLLAFSFGLDTVPIRLTRRT